VDIRQPGNIIEEQKQMDNTNCNRRVSREAIARRREKSKQKKKENYQSKKN
jgi:hypothetical protein